MTHLKPPRSLALAAAWLSWVTSSEEPGTSGRDESHDHTKNVHSKLASTGLHALRNGDRHLSSREGNIRMRLGVRCRS